MFNIYQLDFRWVLMPTSTLDDLFIPSKSIEAGLVLMTEQLPASQPWNKVGTMAPKKKEYDREVVWWIQQSHGQ